MLKFHSGIILSFLVLWMHELWGQCEENVVLTSQVAIDDFSRTHGICDTLYADLTIVGDKVTNLQPLSSLNAITGTLIISQCRQLNSLAGLDSLKSIQGSLIILLNPNLLNLNGLNHLHSIGKHFRIEGNPRLDNIQGLESLHFIDRDLRVVANQSLRDFSGLKRIKKIGWSIDLDKNSSLISFRGLDQLEEIGKSLYIYRQYELQSLQGLENLVRIGGELDIAENTLLTNLDALGSLESIKDCLYIFGNEALASIEGLTSLVQLGNTITVIRNPLLNQCGVESICNYLEDQPRSVSIWENGDLCSNAAGFMDACSITRITYENEALNIDVNPNPVSGYLSLAGKESIDYRMMILSQSGQELLRQRFNTNTKVDLSHLMPGLYLLKVDNGIKCQTLRLVKAP